MFERFTERARQVVVLAQDEARALGHNYIGTEHLLLGLIAEEEGLAARVLESSGITLEAVRMRVAEIIGRGEGTASGQMPFTPRGKRVLELSLKEALSLRHEFIGTEHILLGLLQEGEGVANQILEDFGVSHERARGEVLALLGGERPPNEPADPLAAFEPSSPPFAPEFVQELRRLRDEKERAISAQEFERAAQARDRERTLRLLARQLQRVWEGRNELS